MATLSVTKSYTASSAKANVVFKLDYTVTTSDPTKVTVKANKVTVTLTSSGSGDALAIAKSNRQIALNNGLSVSLKLGSTTMFTGLTVNEAGVTQLSGGSTTQDVPKAHSATSKTLTLTAASVTNTATVNIPIKTSYKVTLNANGGTGGTASLTKWHGETLTLPAPTLSGFTAPTRAGWKFLGYNTDPTATAVLTSYTANNAVTLYAVWERQITGITLNVHTLRVDDGVSTAESDDGRWCYGTCDYTVTGAAAGELTLRVSTPSPGVQILQSEYTVTKLVDQVLSGTIVFRASNCSTDSSYMFTVSAECENTSATQAAVTNSASDTLSLAFFTMDFLGDDYLFNLTADTSIDYGKTYYQLVDGSYQAIPVSELQQDLLHTYYEKNGPRPGHGVAFGGPCKDEGFHVYDMPADINGVDIYDTDWETLPLASGWSAYSVARTPKYRRIGPFVEIRGAVKPNAETTLGTSSVVFANLPQDYAPANMEVSAICQGSGVKVWLLTVGSDGSVGASRMRMMNSTSYQAASTSEYMLFDVLFLAG